MAKMLANTPMIRACLKIGKGAAARDFGCGRGGEVRASPQRAVRTEPTKPAGKRPAARRVFAPQAGWLRYSSVEDPPGIFSFVAPRHPACGTKTAPFRIFSQALSDETALRYLVQADEAQRAGLSSAQSNGPLPLKEEYFVNVLCVQSKYDLV